MATDLEIARAATLLPIGEIAARAGIPDAALIPFGRHKAKIDFALLQAQATKPRGKLVLVSAITPTPAGEGKTTTSIGLADALNRIGKRAMVCLREPSLGPCFGIKGGAAGGGTRRSRRWRTSTSTSPATSTRSPPRTTCCRAMLDNHLYSGNALGLDPRRIIWKRVLDMNDRALRNIVLGLGGPVAGHAARDRLRHHGGERGDGDLLPRASPRRPAGSGSAASSSATPATAAGDRRRAQGRWARWRRPAEGRDPAQPGADARGHARPSCMAGPSRTSPTAATASWPRRWPSRSADYVVTEAGFGADLGAEKFFDIKCRSAGLTPERPCIVATVRALKMHGGVARRARHRGRRGRRARPGEPVSMSRTCGNSACRWSSR